MSTTDAKNEQPASGRGEHALFVPVCSIAKTNRGRFFWAAWWSGPPTEEAPARGTAEQYAPASLGEAPSFSSKERSPTLRRPDGSGGGLRSHEDAVRAAARAAAGNFPGAPAAHRGGAPEANMVEIDARFANAWLRVLSGLPAFPKPRVGQTDAPHVVTKGRPVSLWDILGVSSKATLEEIKQAYRKKALETHPDHGGDPAAFRALVKAYETALKRRR